MLTSNKVNFIDLAKSLNRLLLVAFLLSLTVSLVLTLTVASMVHNKSRTLVPPSISKAFTVSDGVIDESYAAQMSEYIIYLKLNVTPANVERQFALLLDYANAATWDSIQPQLVRESTFIKKSNISSTFSVSRVDVSMDAQVVKISGILHKAVGSRALEAVPLTYLVHFNYAHGTFMFDHITKEAKKEITS
jgi:conjugal transfer pilus assembly protein TraE